MEEIQPDKSYVFDSEEQSFEEETLPTYYIYDSSESDPPTPSEVAC